MVAKTDKAKGQARVEPLPPGHPAHDPHVHDQLVGIIANALGAEFGAVMGEMIAEEPEAPAALRRLFHPPGD